MCDVFPVNVSKFYNSPLYFFVTKCGLFVKYSFLFVMCYSFCISYKYCYCCRCWNCPNFILNLIMCLPLAMYLLFSHVCLFNSHCVCLCLFIFIMFCLYYMYVCDYVCVDVYSFSFAYDSLWFYYELRRFGRWNVYYDVNKMCWNVFKILDVFYVNKSLVLLFL